MASHHQLTAEPAEPRRAVRFDPDARSFEAFSFGERGTGLLDTLDAGTLEEALAETTSRWRWDRGDRLGVRELGKDCDKLHVYAVRRTSTATSYRACLDNPFGRTPLEYKRRLEHICTIDLRTVSGEHVELIGNPSLDDRRRAHHCERQQQRPQGARMERRP